MKRRAHGREPAEVEDLLRQALREEDGFLCDRQIRMMAPLLADRWWALRHPLAFHREMRRASVDSTADEESARFGREAWTVSSRLSSFAEVVKIQSRRTMDGTVHVVTLVPWTDEVETAVRRAVAPVELIVVGRDR